MVINSHSFVGHSEVQVFFQLLLYVETFPQTSVCSSDFPLHETLCWGGRWVDTEIQSSFPSSSLERSSQSKKVQTVIDRPTERRRRGCNPEGERIHLPSAWQECFIDQAASRRSPAWGPLLYRDPVSALQAVAIRTHMSWSQSHPSEVWQRGPFISSTQKWLWQFLARCCLPSPKSPVLSVQDLFCWTCIDTEGQEQPPPSREH